MRHFEHGKVPVVDGSYGMTVEQYLEWVSKRGRKYVKALDNQNDTRGLSELDKAKLPTNQPTPPAKTDDDTDEEWTDETIQTLLDEVGE